MNTHTNTEILSKIYPHKRDENILFYEDMHKYVILSDVKSEYTSVTSWCHSHFSKFNAEQAIEFIFKSKHWNETHKYWGMTKEEIKELWDKNRNGVSSAGTELHFHIECFMNNLHLNKYYTHFDLYKYYETNKFNTLDYSISVETNISEKSIISITSNNKHLNTIEWYYFLKFIKDTPYLKPYRTEWTIYDEDIKIAGSVDMVYENDDGTLSIYDWKRCKNIIRISNWNKYAETRCICHIPDTNFWHYALQLNVYRYIIQTKYGKFVKELKLVVLHPENENNSYEIIDLPIMNYEISELIVERKRLLNIHNG